MRCNKTRRVFNGAPLCKKASVIPIAVGRTYVRPRLSESGNGKNIA